MICLYTSFSNTSEGETYFVVYTLLSANKKYMYKPLLGFQFLWSTKLVIGTIDITSYFM